MQLTLHATRQTPHCVRTYWCKQCLPGRSNLGVPRPGSVRRDARVYFSTTSAMHITMSAPPPPPP